jgi:hypothetical protein
MSASSRDARLRTRNESRETRADRIVIMHPDGMAVVPENPQSFLTVHSFEQGKVHLQVGERFWRAMHRTFGLAIFLRPNVLFQTLHVFFVVP